MLILTVAASRGGGMQPLVNANQQINLNRSGFFKTGGPGHPGFLLEAYIRADDKVLVETIQWFNANGACISGAFYNGKLTGMAGLAFIDKQ